jgi:succinyl-CoA synthetase alpha subunit
MGHADALVHGEAGSLESKRRRLTAAGAQVFGAIEDLMGACVGRFRAVQR